jgi:hypothetical protein
MLESDTLWCVLPDRVTWIVMTLQTAYSTVKLCFTWIFIESPQLYICGVVNRFKVYITYGDILFGLQVAFSLEVGSKEGYALSHIVS